MITLKTEKLAKAEYEKAVSELQSASSHAAKSVTDCGGSDFSPQRNVKSLLQYKSGVGMVVDDGVDRGTTVTSQFPQVPFEGIPAAFIGLPRVRSKAKKSSWPSLLSRSRMLDVNDNDHNDMDADVGSEDNRDRGGSGSDNEDSDDSCGSFNEEALFDVFQLHISHIEVFMLDSAHGMWVGSVGAQNRLKMGLVDKFDVSVEVQLCALPWDTTLPTLKLSVDLPALHLRLSEEKLFHLTKFVKNLLSSSTSVLAVHKEAMGKLLAAKRRRDEAKEKEKEKEVVMSMSPLRGVRGENGGSSHGPRSSRRSRSKSLTPESWGVWKDVGDTDMPKSPKGRRRSMSVYNKVNPNSSLSSSPKLLDSSNSVSGTQRSLRNRSMSISPNLEIMDSNAFSAGSRESLKTRPPRPLTFSLSKTALLEFSDCQDNLKEFEASSNGNSYRSMNGSRKRNDDDISVASDDSFISAVEDLEINEVIDYLDEDENQAINRVDELKHEIKNKESSKEQLMSDIRLLESDTNQKDLFDVLQDELVEAEKELHQLKVSLIDAIMVLNKIQSNNRSSSNVNENIRPISIEMNNLRAFFDTLVQSSPTLTTGGDGWRADDRRIFMRDSVFKSKPEKNNLCCNEYTTSNGDGKP